MNDLFPSGQQVLDKLRAFEATKKELRAMLHPLFLDIVKARHPVGSIVDIQGKVLRGHAYGMKRGRVLKYRNENLDWNMPEDARVGITVTLVKGDDNVDTRHQLTLWEPVCARYCDSDRCEELAHLVNKLNDSRIR